MDLQKALCRILSSIKHRPCGANEKNLQNIIHCRFSDASLDDAQIMILDKYSNRMHLLIRNIDVGEWTEAKISLVPHLDTSYNYFVTNNNCPFVALVSQSAVFVFEHLQPGRFKIQSSVTRRVYCALDLSSLLSGPIILRTRWHPHQENVLVILSSTSILYFVECRKISGQSGISFSLTDKIDLKTAARTVIDSTSTETGIDVVESEVKLSNGVESDANTTLGSGYQVDIDSALGYSCVDFDFGQPLHVSAPSNIPFGHQKHDCVIYSLFESGDVLCVYPNTHQSDTDMKPNFVSILPSSDDNYGDNFTSILCCSSNKTMDRPDVLVLADSSGYIYHGVILNSVTKQQITPIFFILEMIKLKPSGDKSHQSPSSIGDSLAESLDQLNLGRQQLYLEPIQSSQQQTTAYYAVHSTGLHQVKLDWTDALGQLCRELPTSSDELSEIDPLLASIGRWQSTIRYLLHVTDSSSSQHPSNYSLLGLLQLPPVLSATTGPNPNLFAIRAPSQINSDGSVDDVDRLIHSLSVDVTINSSPVQPVSRLTPDFSTPTVKSSQRKPATHSDQSTLSVSNFADSLRQLVVGKQDNKMPLLSTNLPTSKLDDIDLLRFFASACTSLGDGQLASLKSLRTYVDDYTVGVSKQLTEQLSQVSQLLNCRIQLQSKAKQLTDRHALASDRLQALHKRLFTVTTKVASMKNGLTKSEMTMKDELLCVRDRLDKGLLDWMTSLRSRLSVLQTRIQRCQRDDELRPNRQQMLECNDNTEWTQAMTSVRQQTKQLRQLVDAVKMMSVKLIHDD